MFNIDQQIERMNKVLKILKVLPECKNIKEINSKTGIPTSSIQRYLNNKKILMECELNDDEILAISNWLSNSKKEGLSRGGINSQSKYDYERNELGHYNGIKRK